VGSGGAWTPRGTRRYAECRHGRPFRHPGASIAVIKIVIIIISINKFIKIYSLINIIIFIWYYLYKKNATLNPSLVELSKVGPSLFIKKISIVMTQKDIFI
jgi:hypothetical protein